MPKIFCDFDNNPKDTCY